MLIWGILAFSFFGGIVVIATGELKTSKRRHIVGPRATFIGAAMIALPFIVLGTTFSVLILSSLLGSTAESARLHGAFVGTLIIPAFALALALNLKRWSVPIRANEPRPDFSNISAGPGAPDFSFLDSDKPA